MSGNKTEKKDNVCPYLARSDSDFGVNRDDKTVRFVVVRVFPGVGHGLHLDQVVRLVEAHSAVEVHWNVEDPSLGVATVILP